MGIIVPILHHTIPDTPNIKLTHHSSLTHTSFKHSISISVDFCQAIREVVRRLSHRVVASDGRSERDNARLVDLVEAALRHNRSGGEVQVLGDALGAVLPHLATDHRWRKRDTRNVTTGIHYKRIRILTIGAAHSKIWTLNIAKLTGIGQM